MNFYGKNKKKKKKAVGLLAALAVLAMIAGTFAWTSYVDWKKNHMQSRGFETGEVNIVEQFPNPEIKPGADIIKEVGVVNASDNNVFVRISFEEMLHKLAAGAEAKGYNTIDDAGFPVIIDSSEYTKQGSLWQDKTSDLRIDGVAPTTPANGDVGYKLYINDDKAAVIYVRKTPKSFYPTNFEFDREGSKVPVFSGTFAADDAQVAQKVTGEPLKQADNSYTFTTVGNTSPTGVAGDLAIYGFGKGLDSKVENNWAGTSVKLSDTTLAASTPADPTKSAVDATLNFAMDNVGTDETNIGAKDWFYNKTDGYFYYTKKLPASTSTDSTVLQTVKIPDDQAYSISSYDLWIGMQAIPSYLVAMEAPVDDAQSGKGEENAGGWGMAKEDKMYAYFKTIADAE